MTNYLHRSSHLNFFLDVKVFPRFPTPSKDIVKSGDKSNVRCEKFPIERKTYCDFWKIQPARNREIHKSIFKVINPKLFAYTTGKTQRKRNMPIGFSGIQCKTMLQNNNNVVKSAKNKLKLKSRSELHSVPVSTMIIKQLEVDICSLP